jgi:hypothetical protein
MVEPALVGHLKDPEFRVAQEGNGPEQAHFHSELGDGTAKPLMEQAVEVAATTIEPASQFGNRQSQDFGCGQLVEDPAYAPLAAHELGLSRLNVLELEGENGGNDAQQLAAVIQDCPPPAFRKMKVRPGLRQTHFSRALSRTNANER